MSEETKTPIQCNGRQVIYTPYEKVDKNNIVTVLMTALPIFAQNQQQIKYLFNYYRGITPIQGRTKTVRPEINNKISVNRASQIVAFKVGYLFNEPVQYISRGENQDNVKKISELNDFMYIQDKEYHDKELAESFSICGTYYRLVLPESEEVPFNIYDVDTTNAFVVYSNGIGHKPVLGVIITQTQADIDNGNVFRYCCYTEKEYFELVGSDPYVISLQKRHTLGKIPLIEYPNNSFRLGDFELVLPLLDALNNIYSNRIDGVEQFVQSLMKFINVDISQEDFAALKELGAIKVFSQDGKTADVQFMSQEMHQNDVQILVNCIEKDILTICGMPNESGSNASTSDNVGAVVVRQGWQGAEARAKSTELVFKRSEKAFLSLALKIYNTFKKTNLSIADIDIKLPRRNYENVSQKATVLTTMLGSDKIDPKLAFESCGLFTDPEMAYEMSKKYAEKIELIKEKLSNGSENK